MVTSAQSRWRLACPMGGGTNVGAEGLSTGEPDGGAGAGGRGRGGVIGGAGAGEGAAQLVPAVSPSSRTHTVGKKTASCLFFLKSVQLAWARQDVKERESRDDIRSRSDDSYSPRRHWC